uniref:Methyltransferase FkbM domain-containing protein n=1 Tax=Alexandrium catenella TaxID=2925 RepID=A0A7S1SEP2_ALECA
MWGRWGFPRGGAAPIYTYNKTEDRGISREIQEHGRWEEDTLRYVCDILASEDGNYLDVGANIGALTIPLVPCLKGKQVFAVEAVPSNAEHIMASVLANQYQGVVVIPNAVGGPSDAPTVTMNVPKHVKGASAVSGNRPVQDLVSQVVVRQTSLDAIAAKEPGMKNLLLMKMDIEGNEGRALEGARTLLATFPPCYIQIELVPRFLKNAGTSIGSVIELLNDAGYNTTFADPVNGNSFLTWQKDLLGCLWRMH